MAARIVGSAKPDVLRGTPRADTILGKAGNDRIFGRGGNDVLSGQVGNDRVLGEAGNDRLNGNAGNDRLLGGAGNDRLRGHAGNDVLVGGAGNDVLVGGPGKDRVVCGAGRDRVTADALDVVAKDCELVSRPAPPMPAPMDPVARGKQVYLSAGCGGCHTLADARSSGTIGPNLDVRKPSKQRVVEQVTNGGGIMPAFRGRLTAQQIDDVATYVSTVAGR